MGLFGKIKSTAYQTAEKVYRTQHGDGSTEGDFHRPAGEKGEEILDNLRKTNYYSDSEARFYKSHRSTFFKITHSLPFHSTNQNTALEEAISFLLSHQHTRKEWISVVQEEKVGPWKRKTTPLLTPYLFTQSGQGGCSSFHCSRDCRSFESGWCA
jgi:hypothetical protein